MSETLVIDASGLSCPQPVLETKKIIDKLKTGRVEVLVDTVTSRENVARLAGSHGWKVTKEERGSGYRLVLEK